MKLHTAIGLLIFLSCGGAIAQDQKNQWTPWAPADDGWVQFQAIINFHGGSKSPEELAKANLKSLKVKSLIGGRISGLLPPELSGVKDIRIIYSEYGKFQTVEDFLEDWAEVHYSKDGVNVQPVTITRAATQFDIDEAAKPSTGASMSTKVPNVVVALGADPVITTKLTGRLYSLKTEWRRKGNIVEIRLKDYRPN